MVPCTRRRALQGALALGALLAGCNERSEPDPELPTTEPDETVVEPDSITLRGPDEEPPIVTLEPPPTETRDPEFRRTRQRGLIANRETADRLTIADVEQSDAARQFVAETDFASETLGFEAWRVDECRRRELCHVIWSEFEYRLWFLETYRDAHVACSTDAYDAMATLFRIPAVVDPGLEHSGIGTSRRGCRDVDHLRGRGRQA